MIFSSQLTPQPSTHVSNNTELVRRLWLEKALRAVRLSDSLYDNQMGSSLSVDPQAGGRVVELIHDTAKQRGQLVTYTLDTEVYRRGIKGGAAFTFTDQGQYNEDSWGYGQVKVDVYRQAFKRNEYTEHALGFRADLTDGITEKLGRLVGRNKQRDLMMTTLHTSGPENKMYAGGRTALNQLTGSDTLKSADITIATGILPRYGATPAYVRTDANKNVHQGFHLITTCESYSMLKLDPEIQKALQLSGQRDDTNEIWAGGLKRIDGNTVQFFNSVQHPDAGEVGSPFNPFALLGIAIGNADTPVTTSEAITGGGSTANADDTEVEYMKDFPWAYKFLNGVTLSTGAQSPGPFFTNRDFWGFREEDPTTWDGAPYFYVGIANPVNATVQPNKWSIYKIAVSANNGNRFTAMTERLGPATTGVAKTTVGSVTFDAAVHATYHGAESRIFLCNASGHPIAATPVHGAAALIRAYGAWKDDVDQEKYQSKLRLVYMDNIIGHALRKDRRFRSVGVMNIVHTMRYADFKHAWD